MCSSALGLNALACLLRAALQIGTPVYMCPQLISCKQNGASYDATKADIWACGVLLFVMLLGMFPYDHTEHPDPNSSDAHMEVRGELVKQTQLRGRTSEHNGRGAGSSGLEAHAAGYVACAMWKSDETVHYI